MHLLGYFASSIMQAQYELRNLGLQVAVLHEVCKDTFKACFRVYHELRAVEYFNPAHLFVNTCKCFAYFVCYGCDRHTWYIMFLFDYY